jgi:hypothetical protein
MRIGRQNQYYLGFSSIQFDEMDETEKVENY